MGIIRQLFIVLIGVAIVVAHSKPTWSQLGHDVAHWLDRDTTVLLNIREVRTTYDRIRELDLFSNPRFEKAIQLVSDERFPIIKADDLDEVFQKLRDLETLVRDLKQISIVIHQFDENQFTWTIFVRGESEFQESLKQKICGIDRVLKNAIATAVTPTDSGETDQPQSRPLTEPRASGEGSENETSSGLEDLGWCKLRQVGDWLVFSNDQNFINKLPDRVSDEQFRSLADSRQYKTIVAQKSPLNSHEGRISIYGNPVKMARFIPHHNPDIWELWKVHELPACGLNIAIIGEKNEDQESSRPMILADAVVTFTEPAVGLGKKFKQYRPVEIPPLAIKPIELLAFARDEHEFNAESVRVYDAKYGVGAAERHWQEHFQNTGLNVFKDVIPRRIAFFEMRFLESGNSAGRPGMMTLEKLNDLDAGSRYAQGIAQYATAVLEKKLSQFERNGNQWWTIPENEFGKNSGLDGFDRSREDKIDVLNGSHDGYVLTREWWLQGEMPALEHQLKLIQFGEGEDFGEPIRALVDELCRQLKAKGPPKMIKYYTEASWQENLDNLEQQHANNNGTRRSFEVELGDLVFENGTDSGLATAGNGTFRLVLGNAVANDDAAKKSESEDATEDTLDLKRQTISFMMPMPLAERNEDGYRIELKRRKDLEKAIEVMILKSVSESFSKQLFVYTQNESSLRVLMGVYPMARDDSAPTKK